MSHHASASRLFPYFSIVVAILPVVSSIDFTNMKIILKFLQTNPFRAKVTNTQFDAVTSCLYLC